MGNVIRNEKGRITSLHGLAIHIEAAAGSYRTKEGKTPILISADYGEIVGTKGADKDPIDCYVGWFPESENIYVVNQQNHTGGFDEHKVMFGFLDQDNATNVYRLGCFGREPLSLVSCTVAQFKWWLEHGNHKQAITPESLPFDTHSEIAMQQIPDYDWNNASAAASRVLYDLRVMDSAYGQLVEASDHNTLLDEIIYHQGGELGVLDALVIPNNQIEKKSNQIGMALNRLASGDIKVVEDGGVEVTEPYRQNGTTNIAMLFNMTDGQTVTVFFHNPDTTPNKLLPDDKLVSWKWVLNKKDITIVVAKENGQDQSITAIAKKIMALVEANAPKFARNNAKAAENEAEITATEERIEQKKNVLQDLLDQIAAIESGSNLSGKTEAEDPDLAEMSDDALAEVAQNMADEIDKEGVKALTEAMFNRMAAALAAMGNEYTDAALVTFKELRGEVNEIAPNAPKNSEFNNPTVWKQKLGFVVGDVVEAKWPNNDTQIGTVLDINLVFHDKTRDPNKAEYKVLIKSASGEFSVNPVYVKITLKSVENAAGSNNPWGIAIGDHIKYTPDGSNDSELGVVTDMRPMREHWVIDVESDNGNGGVNSTSIYTIDGGQIEKLESLPGVPADDADSPAVQFTGNELGDFDWDTEEGKKQMRAAARALLESKRGKWVKCPAMPHDENGKVREVEIRNRSVKEFIRYTGNPVKILLAAKIEEIIETARNAVVEPNFKEDIKPQVTAYYKLENTVNVAGKSYQVSVIIEKDPNGYLHYDVMLPNKAKATLDSVALQPETIPTPKDGVSGLENNATFDAAGQENSKPVLNLLVKVQNEQGEWVELEDDAPTEPAEATPIPDGQQDNSTDKVFLNDVIAGVEDVLAADFHDRITVVALKYDGTDNAEMNELVEKAVLAYQNKVDELSKEGA